MGFINKTDFQRKNSKTSKQPDVIMLYQDRDLVGSAIQQIMELDIEFKTYKFSPGNLQDVAKMNPKIVLLSSNDVKKTIRFYIDYLEEYEQVIAPHIAILLISNRETSCAYLACENGLFDNYAIINPLNEPYRLKLVLLQELQIIEENKENSLNRLISDGDEELASCIEHGITLKKSFLSEVNKCKNNLLSATDKTLVNSDAKAVLRGLVGIAFEDMNDNVSSNIQGILNQLMELKQNSRLLIENIENNHAPPNKTTIGVNTDLLTSTEHDSEHDSEQNSTTSYKVLIGESSTLFSRVIEEIFAETAFKYMLVSNGEALLRQVSNFNPDVIFLAYDLPLINGLNVTKTLREAGNQTPIVAYIHNRNKSELDNWLSLGVSSYLIKPSKKSFILKSVIHAIDNPSDTVKIKKNPRLDDFHWIPKFSVGNVAIDEQHKELFYQINDFFHQETKEAAIMTFDSLISYLDLHFEAEETLFRQMNYPKTQEHIEKHNKLRVKFKPIKEKLKNYDRNLHDKISLFFYNWLVNHILKDDMQYDAYILAKEEKIVTV